eukprot:48054-Chlamydomonas_euryale.AAC.1
MTQIFPAACRDDTQVFPAACRDDGWGGGAGHAASVETDDQWADRLWAQMQARRTAAARASAA